MRQELEVTDELAVDEVEKIFKLQFSSWRGEGPHLLQDNLAFITFIKIHWASSFLGLEASDLSRSL